MNDTERALQYLRNKATLFNKALEWMYAHSKVAEEIEREVENLEKAIVALEFYIDNNIDCGTCKNNGDECCNECRGLAHTMPNMYEPKIESEVE